ncbi:MAG: hypothetical protein ACI4AK_08885 [Lepagella sp.]
MIKKRIFNDLNELAIICASPVNESKDLNKDRPDERSFQTAKDCGFRACSLNIKGGVGIFASYSLSEREIDVMEILGRFP